MKFYEQQLGIGMKAAQNSAGAGGQSKNKAMPGELIYLVPLHASKSDYSINLSTENGTSAIPVEKRLAFRNNFIVSAMALGCWKIKAVAGVLQWGSNFPTFHDDANIFNIAAGAADLSEQEAVAGLWNGHFTLEGNEQNKIIEFPTRGFRTPHQTQTGGTTDGTSGFSTVNQQNGEEYKSLGGLVKLGGGNENKLLLHIETNDKTHLPGNATGVNYIYIALRGAYVRGGTISELQG